MKRFKNILASINTQNGPHPALESAALLAEHNGAKLTLMDVLPDFAWQIRGSSHDVDHIRELLLREKEECLLELAGSLRKRGIDVGVNIASGQSSVEIIRQTLRESHDLVVRVSKGPQSRRAGFFGNTSFRLLRKCPCAVWIVKPGATAGVSHILGAIDPTVTDEEHSSLNNEIVEISRSMAEREQAKLSLIHTWNLLGEQMLRTRMSEEQFAALQSDTKGKVEASLESFLSSHGLSSDSDSAHLLKGEPSTIIPQFVEAHDVDLLVMGSVGRSGVAGFVMGNTAEMILNQVQCAVLALKPKGFVSPIKL